MSSRDKALRNVTKALQRRAELQRQATEVLRVAMLDAHEAGASWREIGDAAGMSHVAALKIARSAR